MDTPELTQHKQEERRDGSPVERQSLRRFILEAGRATQTLGFGRVVGQIYAYLYFSPEPCTLTDLETELGISKGSASTGVRRLEGWGALRRVWHTGDRRDHYAAEMSFGRIIRNAIGEAYSINMEAVGTLLAAAAEEVPEHEEFVHERIRHLQTFRERARKAYENPIVQHLLG
jgi:DNA-binding transcriptional regulator GbsR (MarR family)